MERVRVRLNPHLNMKTIYLKDDYKFICELCKDELRKIRSDDNGQFYCPKCDAQIKGQLIYVK